MSPYVSSIATFPQISTGEGAEVDDDPTLGLDLDDLPVLPDTAADIRVLAAIERRHGNVDARSLAKVIVNDPLMTLRLFRHAAHLRRPGQVTEADTITAALLQIGVHRFFDRHTHLPVLQWDETTHSPWQERFESLLTQSRRSAAFAGALAQQRQDHEAEALQEAALLQESRRLLACAKGWSTASAPWRPEHEAQDPLAALQQSLLNRIGVPDRLQRLSEAAHPQAHLFAHQQALLTLCRALAWCTAQGWPMLEPALLERPLLDGFEALAGLETPEEALARQAAEAQADASTRLYHRQILPGLARLIHLAPLSTDRLLRDLDD